MKKLFTILLASATLSVQAQAWVSDSAATGAGYVNRVFYSMQNGIVGTIPMNSFDFMIDVSTPMSASIRINGGFNGASTGSALYQFSGDTTAWASLDTTGISSNTNWTRNRDAQDSYYPSAFEAQMGSFPNYGWGNYNTSNHNVVGDKLFAYKTVTGAWKKVWIKSLNAVTFAYTIRLANLNNTQDTVVTISKQGITDKSFIYYSIALDSVYNNEPAIDSYDIIFTKHEGDYLMSGSFVPNQAVTGVELNHGVAVAEASGILANNAVYTNYTLEENLQGIGARWKQLNAMFQWVVEDSLSYFIQDLDSNVWQLEFTKFQGAGLGKYVFQKRTVAHVAVEENNTKIAGFSVYPNPASEFINLVYTIDQEFEHATLTIVDLNGRAVLSQQLLNQAGINQTNINLTSLNLPKGIYVAHVQVGNAIGTQKFIIQ